MVCLKKRLLTFILFFEKFNGESVIDSSFCAGNFPHRDTSLPITQIAT